MNKITNIILFLCLISFISFSQEKEKKNDLPKVPIKVMIETCEREIIIQKRNAVLQRKIGVFEKNSISKERNELGYQFSQASNDKEKGHVQFVMGNWSKAKYYYEKYKKDPGNANDWELKNGRIYFYEARALCQQDFEKYERTIQGLLAAAKQCDKDNKGWHGQCDSLYSWAKTIKENIEKYEQLAQKKLETPEDPDIPWKMADLARDKLRWQMEERANLLWINEMFEDSDYVKSGRCQWTLLDNYKRANQWKKSVRLCEDLIKDYEEVSYVKDGHAQWEMSEAAYNDGSWNKATAYYKDMMSNFIQHRNVSNGEAMYKLGKTYQQSLNTNSFVSTFKKLMTEYPGNSHVASGEVPWDIAQTYHKKRQFQNAIEYYSIVLHNHKNHWAAKPRGKDGKQPPVAKVRIKNCEEKEDL